MQLLEGAKQQGTPGEVATAADENPCHRIYCQLTDTAFNVETVLPVLQRHPGYSNDTSISRARSFAFVGNRKIKNAADKSIAKMA